ncbi:MAG: 6-bladed beta-propeller [Candidatus Aminicenantes bacterium]|nr:6-bladed beta-propeller [Candidatus Aminicenantes bacterium]NIM77984.1 6-bladed beta-propeller [Candidatus Aminicenantes bacterium]NIN17306.1 6-bladed beta-propeller [Candidatus Aminicenantes bacterium]NIN41197.1 6-bladed beta-propeller [Candidatus Aminicenantes bacterium]NIN83972.1 6-bladed beta-propeller [Candidatus Aminicenantes bacterium]
MRIMISILMIFLISAMLNAENTIQMNLKKTVQVGKKDVTFYAISSICEDDEENFYVMDYKAYKVYKFSPTGKFLTGFGQKGEGPGDFKMSARVYFSKKLGIIVTEIMNEVSIFTREAKFLKKINLAAKFGHTFKVKYAGGALFYAELQKPDRRRHQVIVDQDLKIVNKDLLSRPDWEVVGNDEIRYTLSFPEFTPGLLFGYFNGYAAAAITNKYEILLLKEGKVIRKFKRNVSPDKISSKEKDKFIKEIKDIKDWPPSVKNKFIDGIPKYKNFLREILISRDYLFVFRVKEDTLKEESPYPVDVFKLSGEYLGSIHLKELPKLISGRYMYFTETDEEDDLVVVKYSYELKK